jgi:hypothetical protein
MLWAESELIGKGRRIDMGPEGRMLGHILYALPVIIDGVMEFFEALNIIFFCHNRSHEVSLVVLESERG